MQTVSIPLNLEKDYLHEFGEQIDANAIRAERERRNDYFTWKGALRFYPILEKIAGIKSTNYDFSQASASIGLPEEISQEQSQSLLDAMKTIKPWRKGPFTLFGHHIDAEWRSDIKWQRVLDYLSANNLSLQDKKVADIGCNNGYFMFRMLDQLPKLVIGFDPQIQYFFQFHFVNELLEKSPLHYEIMGVDEVRFYPNFFDYVFCMGVIYHNSDPIGMLRRIYSSLAKDGVLIIESQGIPGEEHTALFPNKRYAKVSGTYFVPTVNCLKNWLQKALFKDIEVFYTHKLDNSEQRKTQWMDYESLADFLDPNDSTKTIEGYPAPIRMYIKAVKK